MEIIDQEVNVNVIIIEEEINHTLVNPIILLNFIISETEKI